MLRSLNSSAVRTTPSIQLIMSLWSLILLKRSIIIANKHSQFRRGYHFKENPLDLIEVYTDFSGRMKALPNWAHKGPIIALMGGSDEVRQQIEAR